jgi:hypothetical protein
LASSASRRQASAFAARFAVLERLLRPYDPYDYTAARGYSDLAGPSDIRAGTEVANMTDPAQDADELANEASRDSVPKVLMGHGGEIGDAATSMVNTTPPWLPPVMVTNAGDIVTSTALLATALGNQTWRALFP